MSRTTIGLILESKWPTEKDIVFAKEAEDYGYQSVWINDFLLDNDPFAVLTMLAKFTKRVMLGTGVTNPYSRHPGLLATGIATVAQASGGRAILGIGSSNPEILGPLGLTVHKPVGTCRDAIQLIRLLLGQERSSYEGPFFKLQDAKLTFRPTNRIPIFLGVGFGVGMMHLAGELADGAVIFEGSKQVFAQQVSNIREGLTRAKRETSGFPVLVNMLMNVESDRKEAFEALRPLMAQNLARKGLAGAAVMGISEQQMKEWITDYRHIPDDFIQENSISGNLDDALDHLKRLEAIGINYICHRFPTPETMKNVGTNLLPNLGK